jgi:hypothetical protein
MEFRGMNEKRKQLPLRAPAKGIKKLKPKNVVFVGRGGGLQLFEDFRFSQKTLGPDPLKIEG